MDITDIRSVDHTDQFLVSGGTNKVRNLRQLGRHSDELFAESRRVVRFNVWQQIRSQTVAKDPLRSIAAVIDVASVDSIQKRLNLRSVTTEQRSHKAAGPQ